MNANKVRTSGIATHRAYPTVEVKFRTTKDFLGHTQITFVFEDGDKSSATEAQFDETFDRGVK